MTVKGGSRPACAACRFQRRRCSSDCPLAPFFPASHPKIFQNVHRLYGVGNVMKILNLLKTDEQKEEAMKSIKYESYIRQIYPVDGCYGRIIYMQQYISELRRELQYVRLLLHAYRKKKDPTQDSFTMSSLVSHPVNTEIINDQSVGETSHCTTDPMINEGNDHGFYYMGSGYHNAKPYDWDDQGKTSIDLKQIQSCFDDMRLSGVEQGEGSPDYTDYSSDSLLDDQLWFMGSKEAQELSSLSTKPLAFC
ncbi:hypothetical protein L1887_36628 [Cichorium endivia]|nr:hypothetical protein L1887_36628 [Cichorium endivia]